MSQNMRAFLIPILDNSQNLGHLETWDLSSTEEKAQEKNNVFESFI